MALRFDPINGVFIDDEEENKLPRDILHGEGAPDESLGKKGDFYIDIVAWEIYAKDEEWSAPTPMLGKDGLPGQSGTDGVGIAQISQENNELVVSLSNKEKKVFSLPTPIDGEDGVGVVDIDPVGEFVRFTLSNGSKKLIRLPKGKDGQQVELRTNETHVQWRREDDQWEDLFLIPKNVFGGGGGRMRLKDIFEKLSAGTGISITQDKQNDVIIIAATTESMTHADLSDMPDTGGTNTDHDARYVVKSAFTSGSILFSDGADVTEDNSNFFFNDSINRLLLGANTTFEPGAGLDVTGNLDIFHTAAEADDHAFEIDCDAAGFGDVKAVDLDYITGAISQGEDEAVILVNIDEFLATGGDVSALEVLTTEGSANIFGLFAGALVNPIEQLSGVFANADTILVNAVDQTTALSGGGAGNISIFVADNDTVTIGGSAMFEEIEFILDTGSSGAGIAPTFEFSTGVGTWGTFTPVDGTNGMRNNGVIAWLDADIPTWAVGAGSEYLIRITRTRNSLSTTPIADKVQIAATTVYTWDKDGLISVADVYGTGSIVAGLENETSITVNGSAVTSKFISHVEGGTTTGDMAGHRHSDTALRGATFYGVRSRGTDASESIVQSGDNLFDLVAAGFDGTDYALAARIDFEVDGTPGSDDMPGRISFKTSADGGQTPTEAMLIDSSQDVNITNTAVIGNISINETANTITQTAATTDLLIATATAQQSVVLSDVNLMVYASAFNPLNYNTLVTDNANGRVAVGPAAPTTLLDLTIPNLGVPLNATMLVKTSNGDALVDMTAGLQTGDVALLRMLQTNVTWIMGTGVGVASNALIIGTQSGSITPALTFSTGYRMLVDGGLAVTSTHTIEARAANTSGNIGAQGGLDVNLSQGTATDDDFTVMSSNSTTALFMDMSADTLETNEVDVTFNNGGGNFNFIVETSGSATAFDINGTNDTIVTNVEFTMADVIKTSLDTPAQITSNQNNYSIGTGYHQRLSTDASRNLTGIAAPASGIREIHIVNVGSNALVVQNENASSTAANRIITGTGADITLNAGTNGLVLWYDTTSSRWRVSSRA